MSELSRWLRREHDMTDIQKLLKYMQDSRDYFYCECNKTDNPPRVTELHDAATMCELGVALLEPIARGNPVIAIPEIMMTRAREIKNSAWSYKIDFYVNDDSEFVFNSDCLIHVGSKTKPYIGLEEITEWVHAHSRRDENGELVVAVADVETLVQCKRIAADIEPQEPN